MEKYDFVVGIGEFKLDEIYKKTNDSIFLLKQDGGGTVCNVLCNLGVENIPAIALGVCGEDKEGDACIDSLRSYNVGVGNIVRAKERTKKIFITIPEGNLEDESVVCTLTSPNTGERQSIKYDDEWIEHLRIPTNISGIIVIDNLREPNQKIIRRIKKVNDFKVVLDIGHESFIRDMEQDELISFFKEVDILQMNKLVARCMVQKFNVSEKELFEVLGLEVLILTRGSEGAEFVWMEKHSVKNKEFRIESPVKITDSCGAGDAFLANFIKHYFNKIYNKGILNQEFFEGVFLEGTKLTREVVTHIGSRGHLAKIKGE